MRAPRRLIAPCARCSTRSPPASRWLQRRNSGRSARAIGTFRLATAQERSVVVGHPPACSAQKVPQQADDEARAHARARHISVSTGEGASCRQVLVGSRLSSARQTDVTQTVLACAAPQRTPSSQAGTYLILGHSVNGGEISAELEVIRVVGSVRALHAALGQQKPCETHSEARGGNRSRGSVLLRPLARVVSVVAKQSKNPENYRIDRIELDKKSKFFRFSFSAIFRPPSVVQS